MKALIENSRWVRKLWILSIPAAILSIIIGIFLAMGTGILSESPISVFLAVPFFLFAIFIKVYVTYKEIKWYIDLDTHLIGINDISIKEIVLKLKKCMIGNILCKFGSFFVPGLPIGMWIFRIIFCSKLKKLRKLMEYNDY